MFSPTCISQNTFLTHSITKAPISVIRSGKKFWSASERLIQYKTLYFTLGMDSLPLRRVAIIAADKERHRHANFALHGSGNRSDVTGFQKKRVQQISMWHRRIGYQEYYIQHMMTRHVWGLLKMYPSGGAKISGKNGDMGYLQDDNDGIHRYSRQPLPAKVAEIYDRRKWNEQF
jgi:hypothetical protein